MRIAAGGRQPVVAKPRCIYVFTWVYSVKIVAGAPEYPAFGHVAVSSDLMHTAGV